MSTLTTTDANVAKVTTHSERFSMSSPLPVGSLVLTKFFYTLGDQTAQWGLYCRVTAVTGAGVRDDLLAVLVSTKYQATLKSLLTDTASFYGVTVQRLTPAPASAYQLATGDQGIGTAGTLPMPREASMLAHVRTGLSGRAFRGRIYLPWPDGALLNTARTQIVGGTAGIINALCTSIFQPDTYAVGAGSMSWQPVIFHRAANRAGTTAPGGTTDVEFGFAELNIATQRRRGARGRPNNPPV